MVGTNNHRDFEENQMNSTNIQHAQTKQSEWTTTEETAFQQIAQAGQLERLPAIRLYRRFRGDLSKALHIAKTVYGMSDEQRQSYERSKAARVAGLVKARAATRLNTPIELRTTTP
jgi:hypothetical protein